MKKAFLLFFVLLSMSGFSQTQLKNFDEVLSALKEGKDMKTVIYYGKCKLFSEGKEQEESPDAIGGMPVAAYEYFDSSVFKGKRPSFLAFSETVLISHKFYGYVYNYVKVKVVADGTVEITSQYLKPRRFSSRFKVVMDETFKTKIDSGTGSDGVVFFSM